MVLVSEGHGPAQRLAEVLRGEGFGARLGDIEAEPEGGVPYVSTGELRQGFSWPAVKLAVLTEADFAARGASRPGARDERRLPSARRRGGVDPLQLRAGDYVVHEQHGVGRFVEMTSRTAAGATREYLVLEYAAAKRGHPPDRLYVPTDQLDEVTKYVGGEAPALHRLGGADWAKTKGRARKAVREIAAELIRLYSARMASPGYAFGPDTPWQRELEDAFPYVETPDQLSAIDEVKLDMQKPVPMDRLICGDVGYGKTEIAVRAAFKAVQDGKQVAVLVPTTLLAQQHFNTFSERYAPFPVSVKPMSRFQTAAEVAETQRGLADGTVDLVIGTHRLLSPETRFKRLGLVIIDEEQRFGVEHKEYLKRLRTEVDVLAMSATPIPRTLEMGVAGIREMSTILTPPEERHPVLTFVGGYDEKQIAAAIRRELLRDGQVFFVHNRVQSIRKVASRLAELVPEARIQVAHGQMNEHELEKIMVDFWDRSFDVLVATTIVESGLDIPNANTLIVDRADAAGLSQLHQLRGRVGRGRERAYAYFLYPSEKPLTETAHERLATVAQHTEIGAGMYVALKDLEIRGAGNLLGGEQSGHIAGVGFDLYIRMIGEAVRELKDDAPPERPEVRVELPGQRAHPARLRAGRAAAAGRLHVDRGHRRRGRRGGGPRRAARPLRRAPAAGGDPARRGPAAVGGAARRADRYHPAGVARAVRPGRAARLPCGPSSAAIPEDNPQADGAYHAGTGAEGRGIQRRLRRGAAARHRAARLVRGGRPFGTVRFVDFSCRLKCWKGPPVFGRAVFGRAVPAKKTRRGLALGAAGLGACALIAACSPVQAGSAAIVGNQRITSSSLDQQVSNLQAAIKSYNGQVSLTAAEQPRAVLTWLIRFSIMDQVAADNGISVTQAQSQAGLSEIQSEAASSASQEGFSSATALFLGNGISPQMLPAARHLGGPGERVPDQGQRRQAGDQPGRRATR